MSIRSQGGSPALFFSGRTPRPFRFPIDRVVTPGDVSNSRREDLAATRVGRAWAAIGPYRQFPRGRGGSGGRKTRIWLGVEP